MARYDPEPLRRARANDEYMEGMANYIQEQLLTSALPDALGVAGESLEDRFGVRKSIARLAAYRVFKQMADDYANWWAGEAMAAGLPQTAIAEALGYRTASNLSIQLPYMRKFKAARLEARKTGKSQIVQTSNNRQVEVNPSAKENTLKKETK
ncbi:hypothetical protein HMPREF1862_00576 [Varibaculum cambriense]|uniref:AraC family transcriptional regulator n=1 Tax=Varibaculum cambriense TaxID=184870 RepID=A0AB34X0M3_9ACTO|nr:hypothetical protein [Varibaculum cambriense]KXB81304.1 hypothetical protein HMPREF1862_00576 [Varibaculum cambriense]